jgi:hypothetical protein
MILNLSYNFFYNKDDKEVLNVALSNTKVYLISICFYFMIYLLISFIDNILLKKLLYIVFITDLIGLIINIISNVLPDEYSFVNLKRKLIISN